MKKDFISIRDINEQEFLNIIKETDTLKKEKKKIIEKSPLKGKVLAMIFEKPSLRTRVTFEVGIYELGGTAIYLSPQDIGIDKRETVEDIGQNLSRWVSGIMARTFAHSTVERLAKASRVPVINGLSDLEHPCQIIADFYTIYEKKGDLRKIKLAFIGDGNNVCNSMLLAAGLMGVDFRVAHPKGYEPNEEILKKAKELSTKSNGSIILTNNPKDAAEGADVIYTDVWTSMGFESEAKKRRKAFASFQVNKEIVACAKKDFIFMHCLPAKRGEEVTPDVIDGPNSIVFDQAENRLYAQQALLIKLLGNSK
ncbi:MAG: ornithine carbamoyltransferase [candidate division WOR-3 bacterium]